MNITKKAFDAWLKKQSPERKFCYTDGHSCLIASFLRETKLVPDAVAYSSGYDDCVSNTFECSTFHKFSKFMQKISDVALHLKTAFTVAQFRRAYKKA